MTGPIRYREAVSLLRPVHVGTGAVLSCDACGEFVVVEVTAGAPVDVSFAHEADCPFLVALQADGGDAWIEANGYPIRATAAKGGVS